MFFLLFSVLCSVIIANLLKWQSRYQGHSILIVFWGNYLVASLFSLANARQDIVHATPFAIGLGTVVGAFFLINFLLFNKNIRLNGMALSVSIMRVSLLIPVLLSLFLFNEKLQFINILGIGLILGAFILMGQQNSQRFSWIWAFLLFFLTGFSEFSMKMYKVYGSGSEHVFLFYLFAAAFVVNSGLILWRREKWHWGAIGIGLLVGIPNQLTSFFLMKGLNTIPASIAYPLVASLVVVTSILCDMLLWKERFRLLQKIGFVVIVLGIVFINLR